MPVGAARAGLLSSRVARPDAEIDHFEDADLSEYSGDTGSFSLQTSTVKVGTYALEGSMSSGNAITITSTSGLPHYPERGDEIGYWVQFSGNEPSVGFRWATSNGIDDSYNINYRDSSGQWQLRSRTNGSPTTLDTLADNPSENVWHYVYLTDYLSDGTINVEIYEGEPTDQSNLIGTLSANNSDHDSGGISISVNDSSGGSTTGHFDHISRG